MFSATMTVVNGAEHTARHVREATRFGMETVVRYWHKRYLPGHFTVDGGKKYGYQKRKGDDQPPLVTSRATRGAYVGRQVRNNAYSYEKQRRFGHNKPLVWSGTSERAAKRSLAIRFRRIKATGLTHCYGVMAVPAYFYKYLPGSPNKAAEMTKATAGEVEVLLRMQNAAAASYLRRMPRHVARRKVA
jgi:hypothetical protein